MRKPFILRVFCDRLTVLVFVGALCLPGLKMLFSSTSNWSATEQRVLAKAPILPRTVTEMNTLFPQLDAYLNDHFGFRDKMIHRYRREMEKRFNQFGVNAPVRKGLDGWYFFTALNIISDFHGNVPLTEKQLDRWITLQNQKAQWLKEQGIRYILVAGPDKQSIYPEYLFANALENKGISRFEQLVARFDSHPPDWFINLHQALRQAKENGNLYYKNDSHWNVAGSLVAFKAICQRITEFFPNVRLKTDFAFGEAVTSSGGVTDEGGDLTRMLMKTDIQETCPQLQPFQACSQRVMPAPVLSDMPPEPGKAPFMKRCGEAELTAVVFRDSFMILMEPLLSENFRQVSYIWKKYDQKNMEELIALKKPDVVIEMIVERHFFDTILNEKKDKERE